MSSSLCCVLSIFSFLCCLWFSWFLSVLWYWEELQMLCVSSLKSTSASLSTSSHSHACCTVTPCSRWCHVCYLTVCKVWTLLDVPELCQSWQRGARFIGSKPRKSVWWKLAGMSWLYLLKLCAYVWLIGTSVWWHSCDSQNCDAKWCFFRGTINCTLFNSKYCHFSII